MNEYSEMALIKPRDQLAEVCNTFGTLWRPEMSLENHNCTDENPGTCPKHALCCQNQCFATIGTSIAFQRPKFQCQGKL